MRGRMYMCVRACVRACVRPLARDGNQVLGMSLPPFILDLGIFRLCRFFLSLSLSLFFFTVARFRDPEWPWRSERI